jgi:hypothetical protein
MDPLIWQGDPPTLDEPVILASFDGWTDAGAAGSTTASALRAQLETTRLAEVDPDRIYDYRDRRPTLSINRGVLGEPDWPSLVVDHLRSDSGRDLVMIHGGEPDFGWRWLSAAFAQLAHDLGATQYVGLGSVPGPVPHTRPVRVISTSSDETMLERFGRSQERVVVPASFQVVLETALRDAGIQTLGLWARIPHYVGGEYPDAAIALSERLKELIGVELETTAMQVEASQQRTRLDEAAEGSAEVSEHIGNLETWFDADAPDPTIPTGDEIAAEFEQFLRDRPES